MLSSQLYVEANQAFGQLVRVSQRENVKLRDVADRLVRSVLLPATGHLAEPAPES